MRIRQAWGYVAAIITVTAATLLGWFLFGEMHLTDVVMVFLLGVVVVSMRFGYGPSIFTAVLSVLAFEFFFIPPLFSFAVSDLRHFVTFAVMFLVAFVISHLTKRIRDQADAAGARERNAARLYDASREIGLAYSREELLVSSMRHAREMFGADIAVVLRDGNEREEPLPAGAILVPLKGSRGPMAKLALLREDPAPLDRQSRELFEAFAALVGSALERTALADEAQRATLRVETEQLRNALLSSVSHDLRTPLAVITGVTSTLLERPPRDEEKRQLLINTAHEEALRLNRLVRNLLDMTRLDAGALGVRKEPQSLEEVVGAALNRLDDRLRDRTVGTSLAEDLPLAPFDAVLIEQVFINLLENAAKYTPPGSPIHVAATVGEREIEIEVADRGGGVAPDDTERVFEKFYRGHDREGGGVGLGLTICRGIVRAHGGRIWVQERPGGGASFRFTLPLDETAAKTLEHEPDPVAPIPRLEAS
jgi:two-component system sensor histidine kinase KdpD